MSCFARKGKSLKPKETRGKFNIGNIIKQRLKEVRKRNSIGHWEFDTVVSSRGKSKACLATFVERKTRLTKIRLIVDRGKEFASYLEFEKKLNVNVYFADPYSSWQRGANENTNGLLRKFFPKKFDFSTITQNDVDIVENILNNRPRKCLGY